ncbi:SDR family NAD(P)-dependent oxidoreductase [Nonomuraea typhae]|uniref:SDR family NAD(P)-dependent oxidoreductase n=1 Tax=Nonomuraea typhae TaxID=2603600 RepID=UPI0012FAA73A|nr:SDR family NAD(P)-dependent oxidoreductase [Nonomuraea typhae]
MRTALVTGAADGLGKAIAAKLLDLGDRVALLDVNAERLERTRSEFAAQGGQVLARTADVADPAQVEATVRAVTETWGPLEVAVSNAGIAPHQNLLDMAPADWRRVLGVNLDGTFHVATAVARNMVEYGVAGTICCVASGAAFSARLGAGHYCTSKAGVVMLAKCLALEVGREGIRVNAVAPGLIDHGHREGLGEFVPREYVERMRANTPLDRVGTAAHVADAVAYLCSDQAAFVSGDVLMVDGASGAGRYNLPWS